MQTVTAHYLGHLLESKGFDVRCDDHAIDLWHNGEHIDYFTHCATIQAIRNACMAHLKDKHEEEHLILVDDAKDMKKAALMALNEANKKGAN